MCFCICYPFDANKLDIVGSNYRYNPVLPGSGKHFAIQRDNRLFFVPSYFGVYNTILCTIVLYVMYIDSITMCISILSYISILFTIMNCMSKNVIHFLFVTNVIVQYPCYIIVFIILSNNNNIDSNKNNCGS